VGSWIVSAAEAGAEERALDLVPSLKGLGSSRIRLPRTLRAGL